MLLGGKHRRKWINKSDFAKRRGLPHNSRFSKLGVDDQKREIETSFRYLADLIGEEISTFAYPYGGFHSFTDETECLLAEQGALFSFNVEPRDVTSGDLVHRPQALPRYDCNLFEFGKASCGDQAAWVV